VFVRYIKLYIYIYFYFYIVYISQNVLFYSNSCINLNVAIAMTLLCTCCLETPVNVEDRSRAMETGNTTDYSSLNMTTLNANVPYESIQPTYVEVR